MRTDVAYVGINPLSDTNYISYESSISKLSHDLFNFQLMLIGVIGGQNYYYSVSTFASSIAGMTSQIRPLQLISSSGGLHWLFAWQRMDDRLENAITFTKISVL